MERGSPLEAEPPTYEELYRWLCVYAVADAIRLLAIANDEWEEEGDWPAGQEWSGLGGSSRTTFLRRSRDAFGIGHDRFLQPLRVGRVDCDDLYEGVK